MRIWTHPWCLKLEALRRPEKFVDSDSIDDFVVHTDEEEEEEEEETEWESDESSSLEEEALSSSESEEDRKRKQRRRRGRDSSSDEDESNDGSEDEDEPQSSGMKAASTVNIDGEEITIVDVSGRAGKSERRHRDKQPHSSTNNREEDARETEGKAEAKRSCETESNSGDSASYSNSAFGSTRSGAAFKDVEDVEIEEKEWYDEFLTEADELNTELSGKLVLLMEVLADAEAVEDKVLVFSQSLVTLDLIEKMLGGGEIGGDRENWCRGCDYFRMDGSTSAAMRQRWADIFNDEDNKTLVCNVDNEGCPKQLRNDIHLTLSRCHKMTPLP